MRVPGGYPESPKSTDNPYWISFADMMAGMLIVFILCTTALMYKLSSKMESAQEQESILSDAYAARVQIVSDIYKQLNDSGIKIHITDDYSVIRIPEHVITFETGSYAIPADSVNYRNAISIGKALQHAILKDGRLKHIDTISIEGHTDSRPFYNKDLKGNWGLSTFRAISVWQTWTSQNGLNLHELKNWNDQYLFSVSGFAETRPATMTKKQGHSTNRRIDIRISVKTPNLEQYRNILRTYDL